MTARERSEKRWLSDLQNLLHHAKARFSDVSWVSSDGGGQVIHAHKAVVYARASGAYAGRIEGRSAKQRAYVVLREQEPSCSASLLELDLHPRTTPHCLYPSSPKSLNDP